MIVRVIVPRTNGDDDLLLKEVILPMCKRFGGCTIEPADGHWLDDEGRLISERVSVVWSGVDLDKFGSPAIAYETAREWVEYIAGRVAALWDQTSVYTDVLESGAYRLISRPGSVVTTEVKPKPKPRSVSDVAFGACEYPKGGKQ